MPTWYEAAQPYPPLQLLPGDVVRYDPGGDIPVQVYRNLAAEDGHLVWQAIQEGALMPASDAPVERLEAAPAPALPVPGDAVSRRQALRVIRGG